MIPMEGERHCTAITIAGILVAFTPLWNFLRLANLSTYVCPEMGRHRIRNWTCRFVKLWIVEYWVIPYFDIFCVETIQVISTHSHKLRTSSIPPKKQPSFMSSCPTLTKVIVSRPNSSIFFPQLSIDKSQPEMRPTIVAGLIYPNWWGGWKWPG